MKVGFQAIASDGRYGMPELHMEGLRRAAETIGPIGVRPVSKFARSFIEEGCPTKPFAVKNKSATMGPMAGLIPIDPQFSRVTSNDYAKHTQQLKDAYAKDETLKPIPLMLTKERLMELSKNFGSHLQISAIEKRTIGQPDEFIISWQKEGKTLKVVAIEDPQQGKFAIYHGNEPLQVLGKSVTNRFGLATDMPITADYDLLVVCPPYQDLDFAAKDKSPFRTQGALTTSAKENMAQVNASTKEDYKGLKEDSKAGNWNPRIEQAVNTINKEIAGVDPLRAAQGVETVHHNAEFNNPFADDLQNNVPCFLVLPKKMDLSAIAKIPGSDNADVILIETKEEMSKMRDFLRDAGYYWPSHAKYNADIKPFRADAVQAAENGLIAMQKRSSERMEVDDNGSTQKKLFAAFYGNAGKVNVGLIEEDLAANRKPEPAPIEKRPSVNIDANKPSQPDDQMDVDPPYFSPKI